MRLSLWIRKSLGLALAVMGLTTPIKAGVDAPSPGCRFHCAGPGPIQADTNLVAINKIFGLPSTKAFGRLAAAGISGLLAQDFGLGTNEAPLIAPLLADFLGNESAGYCDGSAGKPLGFVVALKLDASEAAVWRTNLTQAFGGPGAGFTDEGFKGWRWSKTASEPVWLVPAGEWLLAGRGEVLAPFRTQYLQAIKHQGRPIPLAKDNWLEADLDCERLAAWMPDWVHLLRPARIEATVKLEKSVFREEAHVFYPTPVAWASRVWHVPTNLIGGPLTSFTAGQDISAYVNLSPAFSDICGSLLTNQFCAWASGAMPLQNYIAWPVTDATEALKAIGAKAPAEFNADLKRINGGELQWQPDGNRLVLVNLGMFGPAIEATQDAGTPFLLANMFPISPGMEPIPQELLKEIIGRTNLVYYDWEFTGPRLQDWRMLGAALMSYRQMNSPRMVAAEKMEARWLGALRPLMGNSVTLVTRASPTELSIIRNSPIGLSSIEIYMLSNWLREIGSWSLSPRPLSH